VELTQATFLRRRLVLRTTLLLSAVALLLASNRWLVLAGGGDWLAAPTLALACLYPIGICVAFGLIVLCVRTRANYRVALLTAPPLIFIGRISYSMYLYHVGVGYLILTRLPPDSSIWLGSHPKIYALVQLGPVLVVSYLAYRAVERPSLRWLERFSLNAREPKPGSRPTQS